MINKLIDKIQKTGAPIVVGLDPMMKFVPDHIKKLAFESKGENLEGAAEAIWLYNKQIIDNIYDVAIASGIQIIIFLSGLQTISTSMYEAADIEGCTKWESLWKITFPMISSIFLVNWIYTIIDFCMRSDNKVIDKISEVMIQQINYGFSSAMSWVYFLVVIAIVGVSSLIISKGVYYYD